MGFNFDKCGYTSLQAFINDMHKGEREQLLAFCKYIVNTGLSDELIKRQWGQFAYNYNGSGYKINKYDTKLQTAYLKY